MLLQFSDRLSGVQALVLLAAVFDFSNLLISGFIYCLKTALKPFLIIIETFSGKYIIFLCHFYSVNSNFDTR